MRLLVVLSFRIVSGKLWNDSLSSVLQSAMLTLSKMHEGYMYTRRKDAKRPKEAVCTRSPLSHC